MINVKFEIKGLDRLKEALNKAPEATISEVSKAVQKSALTIQSAAIKEAPVNKKSGGGNLRQNIKTNLLTKTRAEVVSRAPYSIFVEAGTRPHEIRIRNKRVLADRRAGEIYGTRVRHPGTRANPFMRRALERSIGKVNEFFKTAIINVFNTLK